MAPQNCNLDVDGVCSPASGRISSVLSVGSVPITATTPAATVHQRLLVMIMDYSQCNRPPGITEVTVRSIFLGPNGDGSGGVAQKYTQCSVLESCS
jgi:hypothetical protein